MRRDYKGLGKVMAYSEFDMLANTVCKTLLRECQHVLNASKVTEQRVCGLLRMEKECVHPVLRIKILCGQKVKEII